MPAHVRNIKILAVKILVYVGCEIFDELLVHRVELGGLLKVDQVIAKGLLQNLPVVQQVFDLFLEKMDIEGFGNVLISSGPGTFDLLFHGRPR